MSRVGHEYEDAYGNDNVRFTEYQAMMAAPSERERCDRAKEVREIRLSREEMHSLVETVKTLNERIANIDTVKVKK